MKFIWMRPGEKRALMLAFKVLFVVDVIAMTVAGVVLAGQALRNGKAIEQLREEAHENENVDPTWEQIERYLKREGRRGVEYDHYASYRRRDHD